MPRDDETEFGLGPGLLESELRASRNLDPFEMGVEIKSLPKSFGNEPDRPAPDQTPVPRLLPGEER